MRARGFNRVSARIGDKIAVRYNPLRSGSAGGFLTGFTDSRGRYLRPDPGTLTDSTNVVAGAKASSGMAHQTSTADQVFAKCERRLIPFLGLLYLVSLIDRLNVGFAALTMNADLGFSPSVFGFGAGIFFLGYSLFQVPANLMLMRFGARRWVFTILIVWGAISAACAFVQGPLSFYVLRFLLGVAEAGLFPGRRAVSHLLVSAGAARPRHRELHGRKPDRLHRRRTALEHSAHHGRHCVD